MTRSADIYLLNNSHEQKKSKSKLEVNSVEKKSKYCQPNKKVEKEGNLGSGIKQMAKNICTSRLLLAQTFHSSYFYHYPFLFFLGVVHKLHNRG